MELFLAWGGWGVIGVRTDEMGRGGGDEFRIRSLEFRMTGRAGGERFGSILSAFGRDLACFCIVLE